MVKVDNIEVFNFKGAFRGLRNPMNSWDKSDSYFGIMDSENPQLIDIGITWHNKKLNIKDYLVIEDSEIFDEYFNWLLDNSTFLDWPDGVIDARFIGPNDMSLAQRMIGGGAEEAKFLRQIFVSMDIEAPLFWWKEMDTYKVGTTSNSCSTMHKIASTPITINNFSFGPYIEFYPTYEENINQCEELRKKYLETKDKKYWRALIEILPEAWNQKRTWTANYQVLRNIYFQRRYHKLEEWHQFCDVIEKLPYGKELICYEKKEKNNEL